MSPEERSNKRLYRKITAFMESGNSFKAFWTLTFDNEHLTKFDGTGKLVRKFVNKIQGYQKYHGYKNLSYVWKYEEGSESQRPHFHVMATGYVPLSYCVKAWGQGFVQMKKITSQRMAKNYVSKYITKAGQKPRYWVYGKRFSSSRDIPKAPKSSWKRIGWSKEPTDLTIEYDHRGQLPKYY